MGGDELVGRRGGENAKGDALQLHPNCMSELYLAINKTRSRDRGARTQTPTGHSSALSRRREGEGEKEGGILACIALYYTRSIGTLIYIRLGRTS